MNLVLSNHQVISMNLDSFLISFDRNYCLSLLRMMQLREMWTRFPASHKGAYTKFSHSQSWKYGLAFYFSTGKKKSQLWFLSLVNNERNAVKTTQWKIIPTILRLCADFVGLPRFARSHNRAYPLRVRSSKNVLLLFRWNIGAHQIQPPAGLRVRSGRYAKSRKRLDDQIWTFSHLNGSVFWIK